jgi:hypothetical protein
VRFAKAPDGRRIGWCSRASNFAHRGLAADERVPLEAQLRAPVPESSFLERLSRCIIQRKVNLPLTNFV